MSQTHQDADTLMAALPAGPVIQTLLDGLHVAQQRLKRTGHVSARDLVDGIVHLASDEWGAMAPMVLEQQGLTTSEAVGATLWALVEAGVVSKRDEDHQEDFQQGRDLVAEVIAQTRPALTPAQLVARIAGWNPGEALIGRRAAATMAALAQSDDDDDEADHDDPDEPSALGDATGDPAAGD